MSTDFNLEPKLLNPPSICISKNIAILLASEEYQKEYDLTNGVVLAVGHYGFVIIKDQIETIYPTQCPVYGMEYKDDKLIVYEHNKKIAWQFDHNGNLIQPSMFLKSWRADVQYLNELGFSSGDVNQVNERVYPKKPTNNLNDEEVILGGKSIN